jgi:2-C-methyl-D-erythritol 4-phosphate cytidylyltransferase
MGYGRRAAAAGVVLASGAGTRVGGELNKVYLPLAGRCVASWSVRALSRVPEVGVLVLVVRPQDKKQTEWMLDREVADCDVEVVYGGATRQESELAALRHLAGRIDTGEIDAVLIHDAARPLVSPTLVSAVLHAARESGGAVPGLARDDLVTVSQDGTTMEACLGTMMAMQTPQGFLAGPLLEAYERAALEGFAGTDTAACMARYSDVPVRCVAGDGRNLKITYPHDLVIAANILADVSFELG